MPGKKSRVITKVVREDKRKFVNISLRGVYAIFIYMWTSEMSNDFSSFSLALLLVTEIDCDIMRFK